MVMKDGGDSSQPAARQMNRLIKKIARRCGTQPDKVKHVAVSALLVLLLFAVFSALTGSTGLANALALAVTLLIGLAKEFSDRFTGGDSSLADMAANLVGAVPMALLIWLACLL